VCDSKGRVLWHVDDPAKGNVRFALADPGGGQGHEFYLDVKANGHFKDRLLVLRPKAPEAGDGAPE
jgi:hypothetical protein